jgi:hypothetical protein
VQKKIFWITFTVLGFTTYVLPFRWGLAALIPVGYVSWWFAYRSDLF